MTRTKSLRAAVLVFPFASAATFSFARKLVMVISNVADLTILVSGGIPGEIDWPTGVQVKDIGIRLHYVKEMRPFWLSVFLWLWRLVSVQFALAKEVFRHRHEIDTVFCSLGHYYILPILVARFFHKDVVVACFGDSVLMAYLNYGSRIYARVTDLLVRFQYTLADIILVESLCLVDERDNLPPYRSKLCDGALFIEDLERFSTYPNIHRKDLLIGFIGRLSAEKGIREFVKAIPLALGRQPDLRFLIIGSGSLAEEINMMIQEQPWTARVKLLNWVDHDEMPIYLNRLGLLVMPSYTEGLPNLALEAMACGTPLLATGVGGIPDLIVDNETGFLLLDRSPKTIAAAIVRSTNHADLADMTRRARMLIERNYSLEASTMRYRTLMASLFRERNGKIAKNQTIWRNSQE